MKSIIEDIKKGEMKQVYLLYGPEAYLRKQYRDKLKEALSQPGDSMNSHYFQGKDINVGQVIDLAETLPFFSQRRVIIIENSRLFKSGGDKMADYLKEMSGTVYFIFAEEEVDKRSRLFKTIKEKGRPVEFPVQDDFTLKKWIRGLTAGENKRITDEALENMLEKTGTDMANIKQELEKLICYTYGREDITPWDVNAICTVRTANRIFDMINAIAHGQQKQALKLYYDLLELREPPMRILFLMARQFNLLLQVKQLKKKGFSSKMISEKTGLQTFVAGKYAAQTEKFQEKSLRLALEDCIRTEEEVKTGKISDHMAVELLIIQYSA